MKEKKRDGVKNPTGNDTRYRSKSEDKKPSVGIEIALPDINELKCRVKPTETKKKKKLKITIRNDNNNLLFSGMRGNKFWESNKIKAEITNKLKEEIGSVYGESTVEESMKKLFRKLKEDKNIDKKLQTSTVKKIKSATKKVEIYRGKEQTLFDIFFNYRNEKKKIHLNHEMFWGHPKYFAYQWLQKFLEDIKLARDDWSDLKEYWLKNPHIKRIVHQEEEISKVVTFCEELIEKIRTAKIFGEKEKLLNGEHNAYLEPTKDELWIVSSFVTSFLERKGENVGYSSTLSTELRDRNLQKGTTKQKRIDGNDIRVWIFHASKLGITEDDILDKDIDSDIEDMSENDSVPEHQQVCGELDEVDDFFF